MPDGPNSEVSTQASRVSALRAHLQALQTSQDGPNKAIEIKTTQAALDKILGPSEVPGDQPDSQLVVSLYQSQRIYRLRLQADPTDTSAQEQLTAVTGQLTTLPIHPCWNEPQWIDTIAIGSSHLYTYQTWASKTRRLDPNEQRYINSLDLNLMALGKWGDFRKRADQPPNTNCLDRQKGAFTEIEKRHHKMLVLSGARPA